MAKKKLVRCVYDKETGTSIAQINTKYGSFIGFAHLHDEDKDIESEFIGCGYAEMRAMIQYEKTKLKDLQSRFNTITTLQNGLCKIDGYDKNSVEARYVRKQYFIQQFEVNQQKEKIKFLETELYKSMQNYREEKTNFEKKLLDLREKRNKRQEINKQLEESKEETTEE